MGLILDSSVIITRERKGTSAPDLLADLRTNLGAARVDGEARRRGIAIPFPDLVIGVTALEFDYAVATHNVRHFRMIPDLA